MDFDALTARTLQGGTDEEIFDAIFADRLPLNEERMRAWKGFLLKRGWRDECSAEIAELKQASGWAGRDDIQSFLRGFSRRGRGPHAALWLIDFPKSTVADFVFHRLQYESGDWDVVDQRMPSNLLDSLVAYTTIQVDPREAVVPLGSKEVFDAPFVYLSGHRLVQFTDRERENFEAYARRGGFVFVDDCNHDIDGLFAKSFEAQMTAIFGAGALKKLPNDHRSTARFSRSKRGRPRRVSNSTAGATTSCTITFAASKSTAASPCCTRTRTTVVSGTTISATSVSWPRTTRSSA